jgi:hypothetical protein
MTSLEPVFRPRIGDVREAQGSHRWSGAIVKARPGAKMESVTARWRIPTPSFGYQNDEAYYSSFWIGIGDAHEDILQAGAECTVTNSTGQPAREVYLWTQWYPEKKEHRVYFPLRPGHEVACSITALSEVTGAVTFKIDDLEYPPVTISAPQRTVLAGNSVEWIVERPMLNGRLTTLANYDSVDFLDCIATTSSGDTIAPESGFAFDMFEMDGRILSKGAIVSARTVRCTYVLPSVETS